MVASARSLPRALSVAILALAGVLLVCAVTRPAAQEQAQEQAQAQALAEAQEQAQTQAQEQVQDAAATQPEQHSSAPDEPTELAYERIELLRLAPSPGWPVWLKDYHRSVRTEHTSGIAFAGRDAGGDRCFFLADEIGLLRFCRIGETPSGEIDLHLENVSIGASILDDLATHAQWDFEGLALDPASLGTPPDAAFRPGVSTLPDSTDGMLAIEGRGESAVDDTRVLSIRLVRERESRRATGRPGWRLESAGDLFPGAKFWRGLVSAQQGIEGVAASPGYYWIGLEGLDPPDEISLRGSALYIYNRRTNLVGPLRTRDVGIYTITGAAAPSDSVTVIVDRKQQSLFVLCWDARRIGILKTICKVPLDLPAPGGFRYAIPTLEGLAIDDEGDFWCVVDPWRGQYRPVGAAPESVHVFLEAEIPMLYRFPGGPVWEAVGLEGIWPR